MNINSPTDFTFNFLQEILPSYIDYIIEVGCGDGALASRLEAAGYWVTALDHDEEAVSAAVAAGVNAICADWSSWQPEPADLVLFTRSLHHLDNVGLALQKAVDCLGGGGMIVAEDFAFSDTSDETARWLRDRAQEVVNKLQASPEPGSFVDIILQADDPLSAWLGEHHHVHSASVMEAALARIDPEVTSARCPYMFRYLVSAFNLSPGPECARLLAAELDAIAKGDILPIGRRFVAKV